VISKPRTAALGAGVLAAVLLVSGCESHVGTAADVAGDRISTKALNTAYAADAQTASGKTEGAKLENEVLAQLVAYQQIVALAKAKGVVTPQGDIDDAYHRLLLEDQASKSDRTVADRQRAADVTAIERSLATYFLKQPGANPDYAEMQAFPVKDEATGKTVVGLLTKNPDQSFQIALKYSTDPSFGTHGGDVGIIELSQLPAAVQKLKPGQATIAPITGSDGTPATYVLRVVRLSDQDALNKALLAIKVSVNPRFGTWTLDPTTHAYEVAATTSDVVAPGPSLAASAAPSGAASEAPAATAPAETAPAETAPAQTAPAATEPAPSGPAATASVVAPSATAPATGSASTAPSVVPTPSPSS
jgi:hypothetical protein